MSQSWLSTLVLFQGVVLAFLGLAVLFLYRQWGGIVLRGAEGISTHHGLQLGFPAPSIAGQTADGEDTTFQPQHSVLVFATPGCPACEGLATAFRDFTVVQKAWPLTYVLRGTDPLHLPQALRDHLGTEGFVPILANEDAHTDYDVRVSPFVMVVGNDGRIEAKGLVGQLSDIVDLIVRAGDDSMSSLRDDLIEGRIVVEREEATGELVGRPVS